MLSVRLSKEATISYKKIINFISVIETHKAPTTETDWAICFDAYKKEGFSEDFTIEQIKAIDRASGSKTRITTTKHSPFAFLYNLKNFIWQSIDSAKTKISSKEISIVKGVSDSLEKLSNINRKKITLTGEEIKELRDSIENNKYYEKNLYSFLFKKEVPIHVITDDREQATYAKAINSINSFLNINDNVLNEIKTEIWEHYTVCMENTGYNCVSDKLIEKLGNTEANKDYFGCYDKKCAYKISKIVQVAFEVFDGESNFCSVYFEIPWDNEHGFSVHFEDGEIHSFT